MGGTITQLLHTSRFLLIMPLRRKTVWKYFSGSYYRVPTFISALLKEFLGVTARKNKCEKRRDKLHIKI